MTASASALPGAAQPGGSVPRTGHDTDHAHAIERIELARITIVALIAGVVWLRVWEPFDRASVLGVAGAITGGWPVFTEAWENLRERRMTMELSMTIALVAALAIGEFFTALIITLFVLIAEVLQGLTVGRGRRAIRNLLDCLPRPSCDATAARFAYRSPRSGRETPCSSLPASESPPTESS